MFSPTAAGSTVISSSAEPIVVFPLLSPRPPSTGRNGVGPGAFAARAERLPHPIDHCGDNAHVAYDEDLANRIRELLASEVGVVERRMFGGLSFLIGGHMSVSVSGRGGLLLRCDPAEADALVAKPHASTFEMRGRPMDGWLRIEADGVRTKRQLERWVSHSVAYAKALPAKY